MWSAKLGNHAAWVALLGADNDMTCGLCMCSWCSHSHRHDVHGEDNDMTSDVCMLTISQTHCVW